MAIIRQKIDNALRLIENAVSKGFFPGAAVSIGTKERLICKVHYGNRCLYPEKLPLERDTLFDMASLTKVMATNTLFMVFLEKGLISLYDKAVDYLEGFQGEDKREITLLNLLTHTSGLPAFAPLYKICRDYRDAVEYICRTDLLYTPGTRVVYSDLGFIVLGYILEILGGDRLDALCERYVFKPLDMQNTCFNPGTFNVVATEVDKTTGKPLTGTCHDENARFFGGISGHAGLFSNIDDVSRFTHMLINKGSIAGKSSFLSPASVSSMIRDYTKGLEESRGLGWCLKGDKISSGGDIISPSAFGHTGFTGTSIWIDIENDIYINLLTNRVHPTRDNTSIIRFRRLFHNAVLSSVN